jgi:flavin-dependent dehydrogenase
VERGCAFIPGAAATLSPATAKDQFRLLKLQSSDQTRLIRAAVVLACDGIGGTLLAAEPWARWNIQAGAWIGAATTLENWSGELESGTIRMHIGRGGYVGLVRVPHGKVHLAAALDPAACRDAGGPGCMIDSILASSGQSEWNPLEDAKFFGAGALTRRREALGGHRVLAVGDACGYVEPFTGEGMAWAIAAAREVTNLLPRPGEIWPADLPQRWQAAHERTIARRQRWCRTLRPIMRRPVLAALAVRMGCAIPAMGNLAAGRIVGARVQGSFG